MFAAVQPASARPRSTGSWEAPSAPATGARSTATSPAVRSTAARVLVAGYPPATLFAVVVTGNHFWIDAVGGLVVLAAGHVLSGLLVAGWRRWRSTVEAR